MSAYVVDKDHIDFMVQAAIAGATDSRETPHGGFSWFHDHTRWSVKAHLDAPERQSKYSVEVPPSTLGQMLVDECVRSVSARYPDDDVDAGELPGPVREHAYYLQPYVFEPIDTGRQVYSIGAGLQLAVQAVANTATVAAQLGHYEYQACEHAEWRDSEACAFVQAMRERLLAKLPGAEQASWGFSRPEAVA
jgi:hypothetical protein